VTHKTQQSAPFHMKTMRTPYTTSHVHRYPIRNFWNFSTM